MEGFLKNDKQRLISIHAPAGGATGTHGKPETARTISIHAPAGGATVAVAAPRRVHVDFNSRPCGRGDARVLVQTNPS